MISFEIPLPPRMLSPNARGHWAKKSRAVKAYREAGKIGCLCGMGRTRPRYERIEIEYDFYLRRIPGADCYYPRDEDNARSAMKPAQDGFVDAGIVVSDSAERVTVKVVRLHRKAEKACVVVRIREVGNAS